MEKLAYSIPEAATAVSLGVSTIRNAIDDHELVARFAGPKRSKPIIEGEELRRWLGTLPTERGG